MAWRVFDRTYEHRTAISVACPHRRTARRLLVFEKRMEVDGFLKEHEIVDYSAADFEQDRETLRELRMRKARS